MITALATTYNSYPELWTETSGPEKNGCTKIVHKDLRVTKEF